MIIGTKFFGEIEINEQDIISFPNGIYAFEDEKQFILLHNIDDVADGEGKDSSAIKYFRFLQSVNDKNLCFIVMDSAFFGDRYAPVFNDEVFIQIETYDERDIVILAMAVIYENIEQSRVNLLSPIVINHEKKIAMQVILDKSENRGDIYTTKYPIFRGISKEGII